MTYSWDLDEILRSMNLPKKELTPKDLVLLSDEIDDIILEKMVENYKKTESD